MKIGDKVSFSKEYKRVYSKFENGSWQRVWKEKDCNLQSGVFVGMRNLINSYCDEHSIQNYDPNNIDNKYSGQCALIAINKRQLIKIPLSELETKK